ncbi:hypothetical protein OIV83_005494 [Microbotryomycetes sp. JL201]|nr:hypothetical protein OIV83_005494 [Microbotryomycetes sp. JL201]
MSGRSRSSTVGSVTSARQVLLPEQSPLQADARALAGDDLATAARAQHQLNHWTRARDDDGILSTSHASQLTLKTIRRPASAGSSDDEDEDEPGQHLARSNTEHAHTRQLKRGDPHFILDLTPAGASNAPAGLAPATAASGRDRSATFGGVELPQSPALDNARRESLLQQQKQKQQQHAPPSPGRRPSRPSPLIRSNSSSSSLHLGGDRHPLVRKWVRLEKDRPMLAAGIKAGALFLASILVLYILLRSLLPPIDDEHRDAVKLPKSFDDLKQLNEVLQIYKERHYYRVLGSFVTVYLFIQAFSIPGSMYLSILCGAMYGVLVAMPLVCFCVATGALLCYYISAALGPAILHNSEKWQKRIDAWTDRVHDHKENLVSYLIVLRIAPLPPHWVVNVVAPHLGISVWHFWISTFFGIAGVSYIHTTIGTTLDQMTSSSDFHLISWQNGLGLGGIIVAVLIPVMLRRLYRKDLEQAAQDPVDEDEGTATANEPLLPSSTSDIAIRPPPGSDRGRRPSAKAERPFTLLSESSDESDEEQDPHPSTREVARPLSPAIGRGGNVDKASQLLGVQVHSATTLSSISDDDDEGHARPWR